MEAKALLVALPVALRMALRMALLLGAPSVSAQVAPVPEGAGAALLPLLERLTLRATIGAAQDYSPAFDPRGYCGRDTHGMDRGVGASFFPYPWVGITGIWGWHVVQAGARCPTPRFFPPEFGYTGEASFTGGDRRLAGSEFSSIRGRVEVPIPVPGPVSPMLHAGFGRIGSKSLGIATAGASVILGEGPLRGVVEWEGWWYEIDEVTVHGVFEAGTLVERTSVSVSVPSRTGFLRIGVEWAPGARIHR